MTAPQRLETVCDLVMGQAPDGESYNAEGEGLPLIACAGDFGELHPVATKFTRAPGKICKPGDIVLGIRATIGRKVLADGVYCLGRGVAGLRAKPGLDSRYLWHWLTHVEPALASKARGATFKQVNRDDIAGLAITVLPLSEQRRIAEMLDRAEALRAKRRAALAQLDTLTQSIFLDMFGDPATNPMRWAVVQLGPNTDKIGSGATPTGGESVYKAAGTALIRSMNVRDGSFLRTDLAFIDAEQAARLDGVVVKAQDVLLNITGASVARVCLAPSDVLPARVNQHVAIIRPKRNLNATFLAELLLCTSVKQQLLNTSGAGATRQALTKSQLEALRVIQPRLEAQLKFARRVTAVGQLKAVHQASLTQLDALFAALQHRAFRGEL